jgi:hypothetical protein
MGGSTVAPTFGDGEVGATHKTGCRERLAFVRQATQFDSHTDLREPGRTCKPGSPCEDSEIGQQLLITMFLTGLAMFVAKDSVSGRHDR